MPGDIRNFFGGKSSTINSEFETSQEKASNKNRNKRRRVVEDSDDEQISLKEPRNASLKKKAKNEPSIGEEISTSDYFKSSYKPKLTKSTPSNAKDTQNSLVNKPLIRSTRATSSLKGSSKNECLVTSDKEAAGDIFEANFKSRVQDEGDAHVEYTSYGDEKSGNNIAISGSNNYVKKSNVNYTETKETGEHNTFTGSKKDDNILVSHNSGSNFSQEVKTTSLNTFKNEENNELITKPVKHKSLKPLKKAIGSKEIEPECTSVQAILDGISTVRAPTPPPKDPNAKWDWKTAQAGGNNGPPPAVGSKEIPIGEENCLSGLTFVFTGLLDTLAREDAQELVKRYGGKVTTGPSRRTSFVVLGNDAGPSKLRKIQELSLKTINEDGLFELLRVMPANGGDGKAAEKNMKKKCLEMKKIEKDAEEMKREEMREIREAEKAAELAAKAQGATAPVARMPVAPSSQLWTTKYAPTSINQICGNKAAVEKIQSWLKGWPEAHRCNFQRKGPNGLGGYRAVIIHGPPGIGKTTAAHLAAKLTGYDIIESNASDTRSKKLVESGLGEVLNNKSLLGYFAGRGKDVNEQRKNIVLIMDEVDGMSAGDRGGVGALAQVCKKTDIPMILICNDRKTPKMKPFDFVTYDIPFRKPTVEQVRSRIATICHREGLQLAPNVIDALIEGSNKDIRQIINMISSVKLDQKSMDYDQGKAMTKSWEKHIVLKPWDICHKLLSGGLFSPNSNVTLNDKIELYFNDHEFSYLMIQENYLSTKPSLIGDRYGKKAKLKALQLADDAAHSISDGDLVDRMIHGSQQQWSLMPTHAVFSSVRPASFVAGMMTGHTAFTRWLGNNSKQQKLGRYVKDILGHMRLRTACDKHEIRLQYIPNLWLETVKRLEEEGKDSVDEVIELMDYYFLTRDDFDFIMELGVGSHDMEKVSIETQTKASFTRIYNSKSHPLPFMKSTSVMAPTKTIKEAPDLEEAFEPEDEKELIALEQKDEENDEIDIKKDKYIKLPKKKPTASKRASKKKSQKTPEGDAAEDSENMEPPPAKKKKNSSTKTNPDLKKKTKK
ncbi:Replication factor C subunit 1 [Golovinomyces cichoracearum]|uniref:Replication factor C subunit 1 n=1 Tax=Golovinomyces cichoracearum TaxID=62708 RepID=A0A420IDT5_9PEZI|nr:Replication factor C subunit 1 [Golovinomyces cichoracearum]